MKKLLGTFMLLLSMGALASPGDDGCVGNCSGNTPGASQEQTQNAQAKAVAGAIGVGIGVGGDGGDSRATAVSGGGSGGDGGDAASTLTTDTEVQVLTNNPKAPSHSAAAVFPQSCQEGASGQTFGGGASSVFESAMCQSLKLAEVHQKYWLMYTSMGDTNQAAMHKKMMDRYIAEASDAGDNTYWPKTIGSIFTSLLPIGLLTFLL